MKVDQKVVADFDAIAELQSHVAHPDVLSRPERLLVQHVPQRARRILDVGCGDGIITRALARPDRSILGVDVSPGMIALSTQRAQGMAGLTYLVCDVMTDMIPGGPFDAVITVNTLHHVLLDRAVQRLEALVAPGGTLLIQDLLDRRGVRYLPVNILAMLRARMRSLVTPARFSRELEKRYKAHGSDEQYLTPDEAASLYRQWLPGAAFTHHLEWRYSVFWTNNG